MCREVNHSNLPKVTTTISNFSHRCIQARERQTRYRRVVSRAAAPTDVRRYLVRLKSVAISTVSLCLFAFVQVTAAAPPNNACDLPQDLQREVAAKYPGEKLVSLSDLGEDDRGFFQRDHEHACPSMVKVDFYGDGKPSLAHCCPTEI